MQHQSQGSKKGLTADKTTGKTGAIIGDRVISAAEIERHIAAGKRMQAEAIAGFAKACFRRLGALFHQRSQSEGHLSRA